MVIKYFNDEIDKVVQNMESIFGSKFGISNEKKFLSTENMLVKDCMNTCYIGNIIPMYSSHIGNKNYGSWAGSGCSLDKKRSILKAYGEFIERYCGYDFDNIHDNKRVFDSYNNLKNSYKCLSLSELLDFDESIYDNNKNHIYSKYSDDKKISWIVGNDIISDEETLLPAQKVFLGINLKDNEEMYIQWLSTGLACGSSFESSVLSAIYEVVERDSFMLTWNLKLQGKRIIIDEIKDCRLKKLYNHIMNKLVGEDQLFIYDISQTNGVYSVITFIQNYNPNAFGLITSAASDVNMENALLKSLEELCLTQAFSYTKLFKHHRILSKEEVVDLDSHLEYYNSGNRANNIDFIKSNDYVKLSELSSYAQGTSKEVLQYIIKLFKNMNTHIYIADITKPEIREIGLSVVRAIIKEYNDLNVSHQFRLNNNERLKKYQMMYNKTINDEPHPFP